VCASCGAENREEARFCDSCGATLAEAAPVRETRKTVTVLFCDVTGSTALGERIDPESLRHVMARYFETAKAIVERHGGIVEKFIGDAVMAVFGVPAVHEDDALRAVRAADELRGGLDELNDELEQSYGTRLELRMGVNTGEVVTGTEERLATGDAVNVAARLEQAAQPGEVLLGEETYGLVRDGVEAEPAPPLAAKGKAEPLIAYRLLSVQAEAPTRRDGVPMVGRERQRKQLENAFETVVGDRTCHLFTVLGTAGVGKSRLVSEFLSGLEGATVVRGRCLSYGEGISYWPVTEVVKQLGPDGSVIGPLASILGDDSAASSSEEIAWAFRKLLESRAADQPLVVVFDDVHWGEPAFLDLVEHVADLSRDAPIMLVCLARPELLDARPAWGGGKLNATNVLLEPLAPEESVELIESLTGGIDDELRGRILEAAGGNPLFVEEMVAMVPEDGGDVAVPPTIQALLAARLDQLDPAERSVLESGAVEGQVFHRGAVAALAPEERQVDGKLITLVRKDLVRPEATVVADDEAYRFRHLLIRDTAYEALPKATRAELHERFATWLAEFGADLVELDEIVGYHLEQAYRYRVELGPLDATASALAGQAAERLLVSAERAGERGDARAGQALLGRAVDLLPCESPSRRRALVDLAFTLTELGEFAGAAVLRDEAEAAARAVNDERLLARLALVRIEAQIQADPTATMRDALEIAEWALAELERLGDEEGAIWALRLVGNFKAWLGSSADAAVIWARALERAEVTSPRLADEVRTWMAYEAWWGPTPVGEGIERCDDFVRLTTSKRLEAVAMAIRGSLKASQGRFDEGREDIIAGRALLHDLGDRIWWAGSSMIAADVEFLAGNPQAAYEMLAGGHQVLAESSETGYLATVVGLRAQAALELGRDDEALELAGETERLSAPDDFEPQARLRMVRARAMARRGDVDAADGLIREAAALVDPTDYVILILDLAFAKADVERLAGRPDGEREALERALATAEEKGNLVAAERARERLAAL
jgi:class 3 adenylate cyclase